jgi:hypothetical protein
MLDQCAAMLAEMWLEMQKNQPKGREEEAAPANLLPFGMTRVRKTVGNMLRRVGILPRSRAA